MTTIMRRNSPMILMGGILIYSLLLVLTSIAMSEGNLQDIRIEAPNEYFDPPTQRLIDKLNTLDEQHIMKERLISELKRLLMPGGYGALDFRSDDVVARLYLIATVQPEIFGDVLSYHKSAVSQSYLECLRTVESRIKLNLDYLEATGDFEKGLAQMISRVLNADLSSEERWNTTMQLQRLLFVSSLQQHARQGVEWKETHYGKIERKLAVQRQELETFESTHGADFESSFATMIILNWPAWSSTLTCGKNHLSLEPPGPQPEQTPSFTPTSPVVVPNTEPNGNVSSPVVEPQPRQKKVPTPNAAKKPQRKVQSQEWIQIR